MKKKVFFCYSFKKTGYTFLLIVSFAFFSGNPLFAQTSCPLNGNLVVSNDTMICISTSATLTASGGGNSYTWLSSPVDTSLKTPDSATIVVKPSVNTIYTVTSSGANLLTNPNFESGNTGFISDYTFTGFTYNSQTYDITNNPHNKNDYFSTCGDHTTGTGNMLVVDGPGSLGQTTGRLWCETVTVIPNTDYTFSYWIQTVANGNTNHTDGHPAGLDARINGSSIGIGISPTSSTPCGSTWTLNTFTWNSGSNLSAQVCLYDTTTYPNGNDFALDDMTFGTTCTFTKNITITTTTCLLPLTIQASHTDPDCSSSNGSITVGGINGTSPYTYSINGSTFSSNNIFTGLSSGTYQIAVRDAATPTPAEKDSTIIIQNAPAGNLTINNDTTICLGNSIALTVSGGSNNYSWVASPADPSLTTPNIANPVVKPTATTTYTVTSSSANLLTNPDFESGNTGFSSQYTYTTSSTFNSKSYSINSNPSSQNSFFTTCGDHTSGTGKMMVVDGATDGTSKLWCETVTVSPNTDYTFSYWIQTVSNDADGDGHPAGIDAQINGGSIGIGASPILGIPCGQWAQRTFTWNSGNTTSADICIDDTATFANGNDFAIDDINFKTACTLTKSVTITTQVCNLPLAVQGSHVDPDCNGNNGSITVNGVNGTAPYTYSLNGGTFSSNNIFTGLNGGSYQIAVKDAALPTSAEKDTTITVASSPTLTVSNDTAICAGSSASLFVSGGSNYNWTSSPVDASLTTPTNANIVVSPLATTTYTVTSGSAATANLVTNGNFESGNSGFSSQYNYVTSSTFNAGSYSINANPSNQNSFFSSCGDHTSGSGKMMVVDGGTDGISKLWCESIPVSANTNYTFSLWIQTVSNDADGDGHPAALDVQINGGSIGLGMSPVMGIPCGQWAQRSFTWNSGNATTADICMNDTATFPNGNDFAIDDISFSTSGCTITKNVKVSINPPTTPPSTSPVAYCQDADAVPLTANGSGLLWYMNSTGGQGSSAAPTPSTSTVGTVTYYVSQTGTTCGESQRTPVVVTTISNPTVNAGSDTSIFYGNSVTLTGSSSALDGSYLWMPSGQTTLSALVSPTATTTFTLQVTDNGCSASDDVIITVKPDECLTMMRAFTPNKDGYNDVWKIYDGDCYEYVKVNVYNRWGGLVYHSDNYANDWDGTYKGNPIPDATYYYVIVVKKRSGITMQLTGNVTIIR